MTEQRRGRRMAMNRNELNAFLTEERTCRVGTTSANGPHVTPLWFVWDDESIWLYSLTRSQRWTDIKRNPRVSVLVDAGYEYVELRGAELIGEAEFVGEAPRVGKPESALQPVELLFARKYIGVDDMPYDERHGWIRVAPSTIRSWDFRKIYG